MTNPLDLSHKYYILNNDIKEVSAFDCKLIECRRTIYEVIKVVGGAPLFLSEHLDRLLRSCSLAGFTCPDPDYINLGVKKLLAVDSAVLKNIRISLCYKSTHDPLFLCYYIDSHYPNQHDYIYGVKIEVLQQKRILPNIKSENSALRKAADDIMKSKKVFETLLVDDYGFVTECSRSNFFAIRGNKLITPPATVVLEGITRMKVLELAKINGIEHKEEKIQLEKLPEFDGAFITGTSPGVLPVNSIGQLSYGVNHQLISKMFILYNDLAQDNLRNWRL